MAPSSSSGSKPVRALAALAAVIVIMLISVLGNETFSPGNWHQQFKVGLGLDLSSGTQVVLKAETHAARSKTSLGRHSASKAEASGPGRNIRSE